MDIGSNLEFRKTTSWKGLLVITVLEGRRNTPATSNGLPLIFLQIRCSVKKAAGQCGRNKHLVAIRQQLKHPRPVTASRTAVGGNKLPRIADRKLIILTDSFRVCAFELCPLDGVQTSRSRIYS